MWECSRPPRTSKTACAQKYITNDRSSPSEVFCKEGILKISPKNEKETLAQMFSCEFCEIFQNTFFHRTPPVAASEMNWVIMDLTNELGTWGYLEKNYTYCTKNVFH